MIDANLYFQKLQDTLANLNFRDIDAACNLIETAWNNGNQIITLGNGGSSMTALHMINDWNKSIFLKHQKPFRGRSLLDNTGILMAYSNDLSFEDVFCEQLKNILQNGDLVIAISGSGNSENVIRAVEWANNNGGVTLGLCGFDGGRLKQIAQHHFWVQVNDMQIVEDIHLNFGHFVMQRLCQ